MQDNFNFKFWVLENKIKNRSSVTESIKDKFINFFKPFKPGRVVARDISSPRSVKLYMLIEIPKEGEYVKVMEVGGISANVYGKVYASFIHNTTNTEVGKIRYNDARYESFRKLTSKEVKLCQEALKDPVSERYIDNIKSKTGLTPII